MEGGLCRRGEGRGERSSWRRLEVWRARRARRRERRGAAKVEASMKPARQSGKRGEGGGVDGERTGVCRRESE